MDRVRLEAKIGEEKHFRAYTDGALRQEHSKYIQAAIEAKKSERKGIINPTAKQEISELVAMIREGHPAIYNRQ